LWTDYTNPGADIVRSSAQPLQNHARMIQIARLADDFPFECDKRVGCEHDPTRVNMGDGQPFAGGVRDCQLTQGQIGRCYFTHGWNNDFEFIARLSQKGAAPRRIRRKNK